MRTDHSPPPLPLPDEADCLTVRSDAIVAVDTHALASTESRVRLSAVAQDDDVARTLVLELLRSDIAALVAPLLSHSPLDLNVSRIACAQHISRWTLQRRVRSKTGCRAKELVELVMLFDGLASLLRRIARGVAPDTHSGRALTRGERRVMNALLHMPPTEVSDVIRSAGATGLVTLVRSRLDQRLVRTAPGMRGIS